MTASSDNSLSQRPIFIVGFPRSGTTLLQSMLATQEGIYSFPETHFFTDTVSLINTNQQGYVTPDCLSTVFKNIKKHTEYEFSTDTQSIILEVANEGSLSSKMIFEYLVVGLLSKQIDEHQLNTIQWIEKTPGHVKHMQTIQSMFPQAKFIEIVRNPLNAIYSYKEKLPDAGRHTIEALANQWKRSKQLFKEFSDLHPHLTYSVKLENIISSPEDSLAELADFLGFQVDLEKLKNTQSVANEMVLGRETWKGMNTREGITSSDPTYRWEYKNKLKIRYLLKDELIEAGYTYQKDPLQIVYNFSMILASHLSRIPIPSPVKGSMKKLLTKMGLWPYLDK
jgi:hypothetical protein